jgi:hypothetical protein
MLPFVLPPSINYVDPIISVPLSWRHAAPEGDRGLAFGIDWNASPGPRNIFVNINSALGPYEQLSRIVGLFVDNTGNAHAVTLVFVDTNVVITVAANQQGLFNALTRGTQFYVISTASVSPDVTRFQVYNFWPQTR